MGSLSLGDSDEENDKQAFTKRPRQHGALAAASAKNEYKRAFNMRKQRSSLRVSDGTMETTTTSAARYDTGVHMLKEKRISMGVEDVSLIDIVKQGK